MKEEIFHPSAVILDMDGLMLDTEKLAIDLWERTGKILGYEISREMVIRTLGIPDEGMRPLFRREFGPDFPYDKFLEIHRQLSMEEYKNGIAHKPGLTVLLDHLSFLKIPAAVATSTSRNTAFYKLRQAGIEDRFSVVVCGDEVVNGKPAPDIFLLTAEKLGKAPSECIGIEDSPAGLQGLHAAGIRSVFIKDIIEPPDEILAAVWRRCDNLAGVIELL